MKFVRLFNGRQVIMVPATRIEAIRWQYTKTPPYRRQGIVQLNDEKTSDEPWMIDESEAVNLATERFIPPTPVSVEGLPVLWFELNEDTELACVWDDKHNTIRRVQILNDQRLCFTTEELNEQRQADDAEAAEADIILAAARATGSTQPNKAAVG
jgi:hypothetical protein